jgi:hypothetical protein
VVDFNSKAAQASFFLLGVELRNHHNKYQKKQAFLECINFVDWWFKK